MKLLEIFFGTKCAECGQKIKGEKFQALSAGSVCQTCHSKLEEQNRQKEIERKQKAEELERQRQEQKRREEEQKRKQQEEQKRREEEERRKAEEQKADEQRKVYFGTKRQRKKKRAEEENRKRSNAKSLNIPSIQPAKSSEMSKPKQFQTCPNCKNTRLDSGLRSMFVDDSGHLNIFHCSCGKVYCDNCSGGGSVSFPMCPESAYHTGRTKIGFVPPQAIKKQPKEDKTKDLVRELHYAAQKGDVQKIQKILDQGVKPDSIRDGSEVVDYAITITPLYSAAEHGHKKVVELLLKRGANVNSHCGVSRTPLYMAVLRGHTEVARLLLENGANVNARAADDFTPLGRALDKGFHELVKMLRQYGGKE